MNLLIEAVFLNFKYMTGIERHFLMQLKMLEKIKLFDKIYVVVKKEIPDDFLNLDLDLEVIKIPICSVDEWSRIYEQYTFSLMYSTFAPPPIFPPNNIPLLYVLHDPGRYIYPELMETGTLDEHVKTFKRYVENKNFYVITVSESSKKDIIDFFPVLKNRIFVVYNFVPEIFINLRDENYQEFEFINLEKEKYFLTIGRYIPTKNILSIVKAFEKRAEIFNNYKLLVIGRKGWYEDFDDYLENYRGNDITCFDYVSDKQLFSLYKNSYGFISASIYEGFGVPLIESRFCGCPRIFCSDIPVYKEIDLEGVIYINPHNIQDMTDKIFTEKIKSFTCNSNRIDFFSLNRISGQFKYILEGVMGK